MRVKLDFLFINIISNSLFRVHYNLEYFLDSPILEKQKGRISYQFIDLNKYTEKLYYI